jgi:hypothetical protein
MKTEAIMGLITSQLWSTGDFLIVMIILLMVIGIIIYKLYFSRYEKVKRQLDKTPEKKISDFKSGEVAKVVGNIKYIGKTLIAPLSGRKCVYYYILVEEHQYGQPSNNKVLNGGWYKIIEEDVAGDVVIKQGNSYAIIETMMVKSYLIKDSQYSSVLNDSQYSSGLLNDVTSRLEAYLSKHDYDSAAFLVKNNHLRYKEGILEEGELLEVVGKGNWKRKNEISFDIPADKVLVISSDNRQPVCFTDDPDITTKSQEYF